MLAQAAALPATVPASTPTPLATAPRLAGTRRLRGGRAEAAARIAARSPSPAASGNCASSADRLGVPGARHAERLAVLARSGLAATAMLGALLLTVTGRARRIEVAVRERTAELQREVRRARRSTEAALRESEQRLRNILEQRADRRALHRPATAASKQANPQLLRAGRLQRRGAGAA